MHLVSSPQTPTHTWLNFLCVGSTYRWTFLLRCKVAAATLAVFSGLCPVGQKSQRKSPTEPISVAGKCNPLIVSVIWPPLKQVVVSCPPKAVVDRGAWGGFPEGRWGAAKRRGGGCRAARALHIQHILLCRLLLYFIPRGKDGWKGIATQDVRPTTLSRRHSLKSVLIKIHFQGFLEVCMSYIF